MTTSASCLSARRWATVAPTLPDPTTVTFLRMNPPGHQRGQLSRTVEAEKRPGIPLVYFRVRLKRDAPPVAGLKGTHAARALSLSIVSIMALANALVPSF